MVPDVTLDSIVSTRKMCDAGYFSVFDGEEVQIYDAETTKVVTSKPPVLKGWRDKISILWRIPLVKRAPGLDDGLVTSRALGTRATSWDMKKTYSPLAPSPSETIANVYQLKTKPEVVRYLHAAAGFPTETTWYAAVKAGNYNSWPWLNPKNVCAHFPESEETRKGHTRNTRQGFRSTKKRVKPVEEVESPPKQAKKHQDVFMCVFDLQDEMQSKIYDEMEAKIYTDQTGQFPVPSS